MCAWLPDTTIHHLPPPLISPRHRPSSSYLLVTERALLGAPTRYHLPELLCNLTPATVHILLLLLNLLISACASARCAASLWLVRWQSAALLLAAQVVEEGQSSAHYSTTVWKYDSKDATLLSGFKVASFSRNNITVIYLHEIKEKRMENTV